MPGCDCLSKYLPDTNLKLKIAIIGAIRNETVVAKSTNSFNLFSNRKITKRAPTTITDMNIRYIFLNCNFDLELFCLNNNSTVLLSDLEYPSNTAIIVPNITLNAADEIMR